MKIVSKDATAEELINQLTIVDLEMVKQPTKSLVVEILEMIFGMSRSAKRRQKERNRILMNKKCMLINSFPLPDQPKELVSLGNLAIANYQTAEYKPEKEAWRNKMKQLLVKMQAAINMDVGEDFASEYLYLTNEFENIMEKQKKKWFSLKS